MKYEVFCIIYKIWDRTKKIVDEHYQTITPRRGEVRGVFFFYPLLCDTKINSRCVDIRKKVERLSLHFRARFENKNYTAVLKR